MTSRSPHSDRFSIAPVANELPRIPTLCILPIQCAATPSTSRMQKTWLDRTLSMLTCVLEYQFRPRRSKCEYLRYLATFTRTLGLWGPSQSGLPMRLPCFWRGSNPQEYYATSHRKLPCVGLSAGKRCYRQMVAVSRRGVGELHSVGETGMGDD